MDCGPPRRNRGPRSLAAQVAIGLIAGVLLGLFLGERTAFFQIVADGFVKLLQMAVLPYVTVSVTAGLGALRLDDLRTIGAKVGITLVTLWSVALFYALTVAVILPPRTGGAFFSSTLVETPPPMKFVDLYIPANPFFALANSIVPAVVVFSMVVGIALIGVPQKRAVLDVLEPVRAALGRVMRFVAQLTPVGVFAIVTSTAGTLRVEEASRLEIYFLAYATIAAIVGLWVLPGLVSTLTPIPLRALFASTRDALLMATVAGDLFIVLPLLITATSDLVARHGTGQAGTEKLPDLIVPLAYNFPHGGKLLSVSFILFAGWFSDASISPTHYPQLAAVSMVTLFGSLSAAIPFLLDLFRIPADTFQLYVASSVINSRVGSFVAAMHTVVVALLGTCAVTGLLQWRLRSIVRYVAVTAGLSIAALGATRLVAARLVDRQVNGDVLDSMQVDRPVPAAVERSLPAADGDAAAGTRLDNIMGSGVLRVGYLPDALPFAYFNSRAELVGFDVALMHQLARELGTQLTFVPATRAALDDQAVAAQLGREQWDIVIGGIAVTTTRAGGMRLSSSYLHETLGFVVRDRERERFESWQGIEAKGAVTLAVPPIPYYVDKLQQRLPRARLVPVATADDAFRTLAAGADAIAIPAERGSAWTLRYPQYAVAVPKPGLIKMPLAFALPRDEPQLAAFVDTWVNLKRDDGTIEALYQYWILGRAAGARGPRWSIIRNVLHWVD